jgi:acetoacetyl-CoA reductase
MHGFTMALAQEVANKGVTVNTVSPGYIATDMVKAIRQDVLDKIVAGIPVKRLGTPEDIASIVSWVASDESGFATGADFTNNGGLHWGCGAAGSPTLRDKKPLASYPFGRTFRSPGPLREGAPA